MEYQRQGTEIDHEGRLITNPALEDQLSRTAGVVGLFAVQLAKLQGAHVIATPSTANIEFVKQLSADEVTNHTGLRFEVAGNVDVIFDLGGDTLE